MPNPQFTKPWHGGPREEIEWYPTVSADVCIGCGTCAAGCSRLVYRYDFENQKAVVADPLNCMVGCTTWANTCPTHAISFQPLASVFVLEAHPEGSARDRGRFARAQRGPRLARGGAPSGAAAAASCRRHGPAIARDPDLSPRTALADGCALPVHARAVLRVGCVRRPWLPRAYSIGNTPSEDGSVELQVRKVQGTLADAIAEHDAALTGRAAYVAGPPAMMPAVTVALRKKGADLQRVTVDSFGL